MQNYKRSLIAGLAIVPLALSSWASGEPPDDDYKNLENYNKAIVTDSTGTSSVKSVFVLPQRGQVEVQVKTSSKTIRALEPVLTMKEILENYK